jgi:hypothetical protein
MSKAATEHRQAVRSRVLRGATISLHHVGTIAQCMVRNLSDSGACLVVRDPVGVPNEFDLTLEREKASRPCRVIWREQNKIGAEFR